MHLYPGPPRRRKKASRPKKRMNTSSQNSSENEIIAISSSSSVESRSRKKRVRVPPQLNDASHDKTQDGGQKTQPQRSVSSPPDDRICIPETEFPSEDIHSSGTHPGSLAPRTSAPQRRAQSLSPRRSQQTQEQQRSEAPQLPTSSLQRGRRPNKVTKQELKLLRNVVRGCLDTDFKFARLVCGISDKLRNEINFRVYNTDAFRATAEEFMILFFEDAFRCARHRGTSTLSIEDSRLLRNFRAI